MNRLTGAGKRFSLLSAAVVFIDLIVITISTWLALSARQNLPWFTSDGQDLNQLLFPISAVVFVLWPLMIFVMGGYSSMHLGSGSSEYRRVLQASFYTAALMGGTAYLWQYPLSRGYFILLFAIGPVLLLITRRQLRRVLHAARTRGTLLAPVLLVGNAAHVEDLRAVLLREPWLGYSPIGMLLKDAPSTEEHALPVLGEPKDCLSVVRRSNAAVVMFAEGSFTSASEFNQLAIGLEDMDVHTVVVPSLTEVSTARMTMRPLAGLPLVHVDRPRAQRAAHWPKRFFDILGATILLVLASPFLLVSAIAIKLDDGGPILFRQSRVGINGKRFDCLKLRTMVTNAEELRLTLDTKNESDGPLFKMGQDPRITRPGKWLRRFSIDEMPQFWNVLVGDMSLIGPRPALPREVDAYEKHVRRRLAVRPGITGLWQVSGRSNLPWNETVRLDLYYVDNWSPLQDMQIMARTFGAVLRGTGAY